MPSASRATNSGSGQGAVPARRSCWTALGRDHRWGRGKDADEPMKKVAYAIALAFSLSGCATTIGNYRPLNGHYPPRPADCQIDIFKAQAPAKPYIAVSQLNVHLEKTFFVPSDFSSARSELRRQACLSGADGVIDIDEEHSSYLETRIYNLSATGIHYLDQASQSGR